MHFICVMDERTNGTIGQYSRIDDQLCIKISRIERKQEKTARISRVAKESVSTDWPILIAHLGQIGRVADAAHHANEIERRGQQRLEFGEFGRVEVAHETMHA
jgi:hypothetical protein